jgi:hypothetical protein
VSLTVRGTTRGHALAYVYPTSTFSIFVPTVSAMPIGRNSEKLRRAEQKQQSRRNEYLNYVMLLVDGS